MFQRIVDNAPGNATEAAQLDAAEGKVLDDGTPVYTVTVHSRPETATPTPGEDGMISFDSAKDDTEAPWVVTFDNFLTAEECQHLIDMGHKSGYARSTDVGARQVDGSYSQFKSEGRTSENAWCSSRDGCKEDPIVQRVLQRLAGVTGIPHENYEDFQLLKVRLHYSIISCHIARKACFSRTQRFSLPLFLVTYLLSFNSMRLVNSTHHITITLVINETATADLAS